jgi:hypothetical protein
MSSTSSRLTSTSSLPSGDVQASILIHIRAPPQASYLVLYITPMRLQFANNDLRACLELGPPINTLHARPIQPTPCMQQYS